MDYCGHPRYWDEIAHASLIPSGSWPDPDDSTAQISLAGKVLVWTGCDQQSIASQAAEYQTHVLDLDTPIVTALWAPPIQVSSLSLPNGPLPSTAGIFCSGHRWVLDANGNPRLLVLGGSNYSGETVGGSMMPVGHSMAYWFDPLSASEATAWSTAEFAPFPEYIWYPGLVPYRLSSTTKRFDLAAFGGSGWRVSIGCGSIDPPIMSSSSNAVLAQYDVFWTLPHPYADATTPPAWTSVAGNGRFWQEFPRTLNLSDGNILTVGGVMICETGAVVPPGVALAAQSQYGSDPQTGGDAWCGGAPLREVHVPTGTVTEPPNYIDPNRIGGGFAPTMGGGHYVNAAILHTLKDQSVYETGTTWANNYDLDRVILHGGGMQAFPGGGDPGHENAISDVFEWGPGGGAASSRTLTAKASAPKERLSGNFVLLPDGSIFVVGGRISEADNVPSYRSDAWRFWPEVPGQPGTWERLRDRPVVGNGPFGDLPNGDFATPRGYHSVALLLQSGNVALMGGRHEQHDEFTGLNSLDSVEVFKPPYTFELDRLKVTGSIGTWHYGDQPEFSVNYPDRVDAVCLLGIGSVTHHFDYGQRYVELMWRKTAQNKIQVFLPPDTQAEMLPEGYYLLFVREDRTSWTGNVVRVPSVKGRLVKVTFS